MISNKRRIDGSPIHGDSVFEHKRDPTGRDTDALVCSRRSKPTTGPTTRFCNPQDCFLFEVVSESCEAQVECRDASKAARAATLRSQGSTRLVKEGRRGWQGCACVGCLFSLGPCCSGLCSVGTGVGFYCLISLAASSVAR